MYSWDYYEEGFWFGFFVCVTRQRQREKLVAIAFCMVELMRKHVVCWVFW